MSGKRLAVWICNAVVAVLSILSILCYFFGPYWRFSATVTLTADMFQDMIDDSTGGEEGGESPFKNLNVEEILGKDGVPLTIAFEIGTEDIFASISGDSAEVFAELVGKNVTQIVNDLKPTLMSVAKNAIKSVAKTTVKQQVHDNVKEQLGASDEEAQEKMDALGITDEYIDGKMDDIISAVFDSKSNVDDVANQIMSTVEDVFSDISNKATELSATDSSYESLVGTELSQQEKDDLRADVVDMLNEMASENGEIDPDALIDELLSKAMSGMNGSEVSPAKDTAVAHLAAEADGSDGASEGSGDGSANEEETAEDLETQIKNMLLEYTDQIGDYAQYVFLAMGGLMLLSMLAWFYILIKLLVKLIKRSPNPTVKLKCPIWLGWLPYLILVAIPGIALMFAPTLLSGLGEGAGEATAMLSHIKLSVSSISVIAMISAVICFGISIFYMVMRKKFKREAKAAKAAKE